MIALLQLLSGQPPDPRLEERQWRALLSVADRTLSTTFLSGSPHLPGWFADEVASRVAANAIRRRRVVSACQETAAALTRAGIDFVFLKGLTHESGFGMDPALRAQTDIDVLLRPENIVPARIVLIEAGYTPHNKPALSEEHSPPLLKPASWRWKGDYYDPEFPAVIELHHSLWNGSRDRIRLPGIDQFWTRRVRIDTAGLPIPALEKTDRLAFAAIHLLRHILRNDVRPGHAYELAGALRLHAHDDAFWTDWRRRYPDELRRLQSIAFQFAAQWFAAPLPPALQEEWQALPRAIHNWFRSYLFSPVLNLTEPNKDVLSLHLALLPHLRDRLSVARRRLFPLHVPTRGHFAGRIRYHAVALGRAVLTTARHSGLTTKTG